MYMCVHVCVQVCVCMCASTMFMCVHVCVHGCQCVCVCVHVHFAQLSYSHCIQHTKSELVTDSWQTMHQLSPGHVCIYDYIK